MTEEQSATFESRLTELEGAQKKNTEKLDEILAILNASKFGVAMVKWLATVGSAVVAVWVVFKGGK